MNENDNMYIGDDSIYRCCELLMMTKEDEHEEIYIFIN
jgi:hypothetical protein